MLYHNPKYKEVFRNGSWESADLETVMEERDRYKRLATVYHDMQCECGKMEEHYNEV